MKAVFLSIAVALGVALSGTAQTTTYFDVPVDNAISLTGSKMVLNGAGLREKLWIDLYVGGLYLTAKSSDAKAITDADQAMNIRLHIVSGLITSEKMINAVDEGFEKSTGDNVAPLADKIKTFKAAFSEEIVEGDVFDIGYYPGTGVVIFKNSKEVSTIQGLDFKKALFGIWLGDDPADDDLKEGMLGLE